MGRGREAPDMEIKMKKKQDAEVNNQSLRGAVIYIIGIMIAVCALGALFFGESHKGVRTSEEAVSEAASEEAVSDGSQKVDTTSIEARSGDTAAVSIKAEDTTSGEATSDDVSSAKTGLTDGTPGWDAKVTKENVLALLKAYDKDGYFLVDQGYKRQDDFLFYYDNPFFFDGPPVRLVDALSTVVHEEFHNDSFDVAQEDKDSYKLYVGGDSVIMPLTEVFETKEMADSVPESCRTSRFSTYVSEPAEEMKSNIDGAYGLLNEFCAYRWELHNGVSMFNYIDACGDGLSAWKKYLNICVNPRAAYAEFKYYILHYLWYAREHHPEVYQGILSNEEFRQVYRITEEGFRKNISDFENSMDQVQTRLEALGYTVERTPDQFFVNDENGSVASPNLQYGAYAILMQEMEKPEYVSIHEELVK